MRCREAKRRLNESDTDDSELIEHINRCPSCAREAMAARKLESVMTSLRGDDSEPATRFESVKSRVAGLLSDESKKEKSFMSDLKNQIFGHPRFSIAVAMGLFAFILLLLIPIPYNRISGYSVLFYGIPSESGISKTVVEQAVKSLGYDQTVVSASFTGSAYDYRISNLPTRQAARETAAVVAAVSGSDYVPVITTDVERVSGSLYAQARDKLNKIEIDAKGKTDEEIKADIKLKLKSQGVNNPVIDVSTKADGMREIKIGISDSSATAQEKREMEIAVKGDRISFDSPEKITVATEGKTEAEIKAEIEKELKSRGIEDPNVTVTREADGQRKIDIEIKKEEKPR